MYSKTILSTALIAAALTLASAETPASTPAEKKIAAANAAIDKNPKFVDAYSNLALALAMRARETSDVSFYEKGLEAVDRALAIDPNSFSALKARTWILLGKHEFGKALKVAQGLHKRSGDDLMVYGFLSDAYTELGDYAEAEKATQWMLDLRPGNSPALTRAAHLRELFGDPEGALELMQMSYQQLASADSEDRAWVLVQMAHLRLNQGRLDDAERLSTQALQTFPDYHYALGQLAKVRRHQKRFTEAVELERKRLVSAPHAENRFVLAESLQMAGQKEEAQQAFAEFERAARAEMNTADNANHELISYYANYARKPKLALEVAKLEIARRQDVNTLHAMAWALHCSGQDAEAERYMDRALAVGVKDAEMYRHAAAIAAGRKKESKAAAFRRQAAELAPVSSLAANTRPDRVR